MLGGIGSIYCKLKRYFAVRGDTDNRIVGSDEMHRVHVKFTKFYMGSVLFLGDFLIANSLQKPNRCLFREHKLQYYLS